MKTNLLKKCGPLYKRALMFCTMLVACLNLFAADFQVDGIYYKKSSNNEVSVSYGSNMYSGSVIIPEKVTYAGIEYSVTSISFNAFSSCHALTSVTIPESVTSIGRSAFNYCGLTSITIPESVTSISEFAFQNCYSLLSITIPKSVTSIAYQAFGGCSSLTTIDVDPNNSAYTSVDGILFNKDITELNQYPAGKSCDYVIPNSVNSIVRGAFISCSYLTSITIPESVTSIGRATFDGCIGLTSVTIPNSVTTIGQEAFKGCKNVTSVTIGSSVATIDYSAFERCLSLTSITSLAVEPPVCADYVFNFNDLSACELHVPQGSVEAYKAAETWKDFTMIYGDSSAVEAIEAESAEPVEIYNLQGVRVGNATDCLPRGIYIIRRGASVSKLKI